MFSFLNISVTLPTFHPLCIVTMSIVYVNKKKKKVYSFFELSRQRNSCLSVSKSHFDSFSAFLRNIEIVMLYNLIYTTNVLVNVELRLTKINK